MITGHVCLAADPRMLTTCADTGAGGLSIRLGTETATTSDDGTFSIPGVTATGNWIVTGANIVTSVKVATGATYEIPALATTTYADMMTANDVTLAAGQGTLMAHTIHNGAGLVGVTGSTSPTATYSPLYDGTTSDGWLATVGTGANGVIWSPGLTVGNATLTAHPMTGSNIATGSQSIQDGAITFVDILFP